ncbi:BON domain-containing protein [Paraburkholderia bonniea]|uniref:BON domain-containing protein n=1 Tax=Paraburkholderia bonniea TaxID=2152891 RepID=UPI0012910E79|nr:BON domain-containing protein [Paraburkholderia bonniea]WJF90885.1 BON domain-containing protein [Paraburkholderia bonniea]WJF94200.1 BON domain-containing protein [Paraburkholderia bonniea]
MKSVELMKMLGGVLALTVACQVSAQGSDAMAAGTMASAPAAAAPAAKSSSKHANGALGRKVRGALAKAQGIDVSKISVRARNGSVTLTGSVPDAGQIDLATQAAKSVAGVKSVQNKLSVQSQ